LLLPKLNPIEPPWYGPVCPVVWEGRRREVSPYPDQRRILVVAGRGGEGLFTIRFADLRRGVTRTATYALASRLRASRTEARVNEAGQGCCVVVEILGEPPVSFEPGKGALDHPAA
jgi:hypothetical protein